MRFYRTIESMLNRLPNYSDPFVLQWEIPEPRDECERLYIVFDGVEEYIRQFRRGRYNTCHECFIPIMGTNIIGHPAFDIDMELQELNPSWQEDLLKDIHRAMKVVFPDIDIDKLVPVWMTGTNPSKISRHLVISNIALTSWSEQMKAIVEVIRDIRHPCSSRSVIEAIDDGIYRRHGSLRLPMNSKRPSPVTSIIDGHKVTEMKTYPMLLDDPRHTILDGLVLIHEANMYTMNDAIILSIADMKDEYVPVETIHEEEYEVDDSLAGEAFRRLNQRWDTGLSMGTGTGRFIPLNRMKPGKCPISNIEHESDNAYLLVTSTGRIMYGCHRGCKVNGKSKLMDITPVKKSRGEINAMICMERLQKLGIEI